MDINPFTDKDADYHFLKGSIAFYQLCLVFVMSLLLNGVRTINLLL